MRPTGVGSSGDPMVADATSVSYEAMADVARTRLSFRSALALVFTLGATVLVLEVARNAERVLAWVFAAMAIAALVYPAFAWLSHFRFVPRAVAALLLALVTLGTLGFIGYRVVHDVSNAMSSVETQAPQRAAQLEKNSDFFREIKLRERVQKLVDAIPKRLAGGEAPQAIKSALTRGVAFVAGVILTIFFVLYGPRLVEGALGLIDDEDARLHARHVVRRGSARALFFARVKLWESIVEALLAFAIARAAGVPGAAALAVWVGLWSLLPVAGVLIGALPIVVFAGAHTMTRAVVVALLFVVIGACDFTVNRWLERRSVYPGSFALVLAAFGGLELYGLTGALLGPLSAVLVIALISEIGLEEMSEAIGARSDAAASPAS
jgi:predicted PurR-regulated permease PerM